MRGKKEKRMAIERSKQEEIQMIWLTWSEKKKFK